jgi:hypothetical protein
MQRINARVVIRAAYLVFEEEASALKKQRVA